MVCRGGVRVNPIHQKRPIFRRPMCAMTEERRIHDNPANDDAPCPLTLPTSLAPIHASLLRDHGIEDAGHLAWVLKTDVYDGHRIVYVITNPERTAIVYIGGTEGGRDLRARLRCHLKDRDKIGHVERDSFVYVHIMVTEFMVLSHFREDTGALPRCNKRLVAFH